MWVCGWPPLILVLPFRLGDAPRMRWMLLVLALAAACGPSKSRNDGGGGDDDVDPFQDAPCPTALVGKVYAPNGTLPLYNVTVYAPISDPPPFTPGVQCGQCSSTLPGGAYTSTVTDSEGKFRLEGVPPGTNVPIIVTTGKWRRKIVMPEVVACTDTQVPDSMFRLPKNRTEGEMPRIAVVLGGCDGLACILSKLGIDAAEFGSSSAGNTAVVFYSGAGVTTAPGTPQPSTALHGNLNEMKKFDVVINSCECSEHNEVKTSPDLLRQYADIGGRVLGSHFHYTWGRTLIPQWQSAAQWTAGGNPSSTPDLVNQTHPGGMALAKWLQAVGASTTLGQVALGVKTYDVGTVNAPTLSWLTASGVNPITHYLSFDTPVGVAKEMQCGKVVYAGMHVTGSQTVGTNFPASCSSTFSPEEKAFVFLLFDLTTCLGSIF